MVSKRTLGISLIFYAWNVGLLLMNLKHIQNNVLYILDWVTIGLFGLYGFYVYQLVRKGYISNDTN